MLSKHQLCTERELDILSDTLGELNEDTPRIKIGPEPENPLDPELLFGLDTKLFELKDGERVDWENVGGKPGDWHGDEVETRTVWTGRKPGMGKGKEKATHGHAHAEGEACACEGDAPEDGTAQAEAEVKPLERSELEAQLGKLSFEIYRGESMCLSVCDMLKLPRSEGIGAAERRVQPEGVDDPYPQLRVLPL